MKLIKRQLSITIFLAFTIGTLFGLVVLGWVAFPVQWTEVGIQNLAPADQEWFLKNVADLYALDGDAAKVQYALTGWNGELAACRLAASSGEPAEAARLQEIAKVMRGQECASLAPVNAKRNNSSQLIVFLSLLLLNLLLAIVLIIRRRRELAQLSITETLETTGSETSAATSIGPPPQPTGQSGYVYQSDDSRSRPNWRERRRQQRTASMRRLREGWSIFVESRIAVMGCVLLLVFGFMPLIQVGLRATVWQGKEYDPIYGFEMDSIPNPAPPSWIPETWLAADDVHRFDLNRPSFEHLLGTDTLGRDVLSVLLASTTTTFIVGITAALTTAVIGVAIGALSAYYRGGVDRFFTHISDAFLLLPPSHIHDRRRDFPADAADDSV